MMPTGAFFKLHGDMVKLFIGFSVLFTYCLMVMGNVVTTTGSGLACPDWPLCYGTVTPPFKFQIWFEWSHRLLGASTGLFILGSTLLVWARKVEDVRWYVTGALALLGVGGAFGGVIVLIEAPLLEGPLHVLIISFHILLATVIFSLMMISFRLMHERGVMRAEPAFYPALFGLVFVQVIIGIFVRYSQASLACPDFPMCRGAWLPDLVEFKVTIHFIHRLVALAVFTLVTGYLVKAVRAGADAASAAVTFALVVAQATLGAYVVWSGMFLPYVVLHGANGFALLGWLAYRSAPYLAPGAARREEAV